ncbi:DUF4190 domain-containing protein [Haliangium sp.]|uniref:DUF4190 domain-containing protein n=1 Tax=Haliangium sp. TaxID=2663208 RepID=UPI003D128753
MEAARQLKANLKLQGQPCGACERPFQLGDDVSVCNACDAALHTGCWDDRGGCSTAQCVNAPLQKLEPEPAQATASPNLPPGFKQCPACQFSLAESAEFCSNCGAITTPDGVYRGPKENAPGSTAALVYGIIGLFFCGLIFGILAISKAKSAKELIANDPRYGGEGMATAGQVLGIIDLVLWGLIIIVRAAGGL